jgi:phage gp45-like
MPGVIESYEFKEQRASIKIAIKQLYNTDTYVDYPILSGVPVIFPRSGGASITMPVNRGDSCLVMFLDTDLRAWLLGGDNLKPRTTRSHHLSDAVAIMGLSPFSTISPAENNTDMLIAFSDSKVRLKPKGIIDIETAKEVNIETESITINCKNAEIKASEKTIIECKNAEIKAAEDVVINSKTANITTSENAIIKCQNAIIEASGDIKTKAPTFTQEGNMKIEGNIEVTGTSKLTGNVDSDSTIKGNAVKAGSVDLSSHTHSYSQPTIGSSPTAAKPGTTAAAN